MAHHRFNCIVAASSLPAIFLLLVVIDGASGCFWTTSNPFTWQGDTRTGQLPGGGPTTRFTKRPLEVQLGLANGSTTVTAASLLTDGSLSFVSRALPQSTTTSLPKVEPAALCGFSQFSSGLDSANATLNELKLTGRTRASEYPWQVFITVTKPGPSVSTCSGVVVDKRWVLTTASCIYSAYHDPNEITVYFAAYSQPLVTEGVPASMFTIEVASVHYHPRFDTAQLAYDVALLKLVSDIDLSQWDVQAVCLPKTTSDCEIACSTSHSLGRAVVGWLIASDTVNKRPGISIAVRKAPAAGSMTMAAASSEHDAADQNPSLSVMSMRILQKFGRPRTLLPHICARRGFVEFDNETRFCVEIRNEPRVDACALHPGSVLLSAGKSKQVQGIQFSICALKSAPQEVPPNNCIYSSAFSRRSISLFADICPAIDWINARSGSKMRKKPPPSLLSNGRRPAGSDNNNNNADEDDDTDYNSENNQSHNDAVDGKESSDRIAAQYYVSS